MPWIVPITDRTQSDVDYAVSLLSRGWIALSTEEQAEWLSGMKGTLNISDLSRIENNIQLLSDVLELGLTTYAGSIPEFPTQSYFVNLLNNTAVVRGAYSIHATTPAVPSAPVNLYSKVNDIEAILLDIYTIIMSNFDYYCDDELYCDDNFSM